MIKTIQLKEITSKTENYRSSKENDVGPLMASIKKTGLLNPLTVKKIKGGYRLVAGFRRYNACSKLKMENVTVNIVSSSNSDIAINLIENMQRENTSSFEIGRGIYNILKKDKLSKGECAVLLGLKINTLNDFLKLYEQLPAKFRSCVYTAKAGSTKTVGAGKISNGVALAILNNMKAGRINRAQACSLLEEAKTNKDIKSTNVTALVRQIGKNKSIKACAKSTKGITIKANLSAYHYKKLGESPHKTIRDCLEKNLKIKFL